MHLIDSSGTMWTMRWLRRYLSFDKCTTGLKCAQLNAKGGSIPSTPICLQTIGRNQSCNGIKDYDPCEYGFSCDYERSNVCLPNAQYAGVGDGCLTDGYCLSSPNYLYCDQNQKKCVQATPGVCRTDDACPFNQFCYNSSLFTNGTCQPATDVGQPCGQYKCKFGSYCDTVNTQTCVAVFSVNVGGSCAGIYSCMPNLQCYDDGNGGGPKCVNPSYHFVSGPAVPVAWGPECFVTLSTPYGCQCNNVAGVTQYLKETILTYKTGCQTSFNAFSSCVSSHNCYVPLNQFNTFSAGADSCLLNNCYNQLKNLELACSPDGPGLVGAFCGASSITIFFLMLVLTLFI